MSLRMAYWFEEAVIAVCGAQECLPPQRLGIPEYGLWRERITCILGSQVPNWMGVAAASQLDRHGLIHRSGVFDVERIAAALRTPLDSPHGPRHYRFPNARARQIVAAHLAVERLYGDL